ncbi:hypothetical protein AYO44_02935 [Planctomycetaceae bacterium SCGC AG-212-F19]|nr:hypothetical protein AYO44_02935 [Planctomycetaceae bacterium SCGC AG-212-F19]
MNKLALPILTLALAAGLASAQTPPRVYTNPVIPTVDALNRVGLKLAWKTALPVEDSRDGIATTQVVGDRIFVQLRNGAVLAINADTGQTIWRARVGQAYKVMVGLGFNYDSVFGVNGTRLFALDRASGRTKWESDLPNVPTAAPVADSMRAYVCLTGNRINVYRLPVPDLDGFMPEGAKPPPPPAKPAAPGKIEPLPPPPDTGPRRSSLGTYYGSESRVATPLTSGNRPGNVTYTPLASALQTSQSLAKGYELPLSWEYLADSRLAIAPLLSLRKPGEGPGFLMLPSARGTMYGSSKAGRALVYSFQTEGPVSAPPGQYGDIAYIPYEDDTLVAMNIENGKLLWRVAMGGTSRRRPEVTDEDVYMMPERSGLYRLNRATGEVIWHNPKAEQFLAANPQSVYALDRRGQVLILDRARGTQIGTLDIRDFSVPMVNDYTDRMYLAAHDGLLICLYDRHYDKPAWNKQLLEEKKPEPPKKADAMGEKMAAPEKQ